MRPMRHPSSPLAWAIKRQENMHTKILRYNLATYCCCRDFEVMGALKPMFLTVSFVFLGAFHFSEHAEAVHSAGHRSGDMLEKCKVSAKLCKKEDLIPEHLDMFDSYFSDIMLKKCKISTVLCKKEDLLPEHLEELELTE